MKTIGLIGGMSWEGNTKILADASKKLENEGK